MQNYNPFDWFWVVGGDDSRAWSSAAASYVSEWPADMTTRIANEAELSDVLRAYGLRGPAATAEDVRQELVRRQCELIGAASETELQRHILNGTREATELQNIKLKHLADPATAPDWTEGQTAMAAYLEYVEAQLSALEAIAETLTQTLPANFADVDLWHTQV